MYPIPPNEHLVASRNCRLCQTSFPITDKDMEFYAKVSPSFGDKKYVIPPPTLCPDCRQQRRLSFRNERKLYNRKCDATGKDIVSIYSPDKPYTVYHQDYWWSDVWDPMNYGREFDFGRSAMEQFGELMREVPRIALSNKSSENAEYGNLNTDLKSCYLCFATGYSENSSYLATSAWCSKVLDSYWSLNSENCYEIIDSNHCYNSQYVYFSENITNSSYIENCKNMSESIMCVNIYGKKFHFLNKAYSEKEFLEIKRQLKDQKIFQTSLVKYRNLIKESPISNRIISSEECIGDYIVNSKNCIQCFDATNCTDCKYCSYIGLHVNNCYDCGGDTFQTDFGYESSIIPFGNTIRFCYNCWGSSDALYSIDNFSCSHIFLCTGLRNKSYCILNKQCTKEEYEKLVPRIIEKMMEDGEWGEFFPASMSPFGYNETVAQEYFPIASPQPSPKREGASETFRKVWISSSPSPLGEEVRGGGNGAWFNWSDYEAPFPKVEKIIPASRLPDSIESIPDDILNWAIECEVSGKPFRIIRQELEFYRKHSLPIPRRHPDQRHLDRMSMRNPRKLFERICDCEECEENWKRKKTDTQTEDSKESTELFVINPKTGKNGKKMITTYAPERPETVYCEVCYEREVMG